MMHATVCRLQAKLVSMEFVFDGCSLEAGDAVKISVSREGGGGVGGSVDVWWWGLRDRTREGLSETAELIDAASEVELGKARPKLHSQPKQVEALATCKAA
jgi:hypothetical protein